MRTFVAVMLAATALVGQTPRKSPHATITGTVGAANIKVSYGRPYLKGRALDTLVPPGEIWRVGADEATTLTTDKDIMLGTLAVPAGTYALFAMPSAASWKLIVNKKAQQWGLDYAENKAQDLGQTTVKITTASSSVEQFTMAIADNKLQMMWGTTVAEVPLKVK